MTQMVRQNVGMAGFTFLLASVCLTPFAHAADYTPPPLFGAPSTVSVEPALPAPAPVVRDNAPLVVPPVLTRASAPPVDVHHTADLDAAASVAERVPVPVQQAAPISTDILLNHPADRVAKNAEAAMTARIRIDEHGIPDLIGYDEMMPASAPVPVVAKGKKSKVAVAAPAPVPKRVAAAAQVPVSADTLFNDLPPVDSANDLSGLLNVADTSVSSSNAAPPLPLVTRGTGSDDAERVNISSHILVPFFGHLTELQKDQMGVLDSNVISRLIKSPSMRIGVDAYAAPDEGGDGSDRRIALARGLSVREYLMKKGIDSKRIDVRALGKNTDKKPLDRVDMVFK